MLQNEALRRDLNVAQQHLARVQGVTTTSGLDVFAANSKVREQAAALSTLRGEVCSNTLASRACAVLTLRGKVASRPEMRSRQVRVL